MIDVTNLPGSQTLINLTVVGLQRKLIEYANQDLFIRVSASDLDSANSKWKVWVAMAISSAIVMLLVVLYICIFWKTKKSEQGIRFDFRAEDDNSLQLPIFDMVTILRATNNFCDSNKLGEGGFGPVYKGQLSDGQEIAVKRLSEDSRQGENKEDSRHLWLHGT
ncbi:hypothetical protein NL676_012020 [Syzygium grande]|nr:hypothetical protein NL676_012020 [Syzygium grande]